MGREIPIALQQHLDQRETTVTHLLKINPVTPGFPSYGVTACNVDIVYDDGTGPLLYSARVGMQPTAVQFRGDLSVDNAESTSLIPEFDVPVREEDIRAGIYDFAEFSLYEVNYSDLSQGHVTIQKGTIGQVEIDSSGLSMVNEFRGFVARLKQSVCEKDSLTCRAIFGSQPVGSPIPGKQVKRGWCGFNAEALFDFAEVVSVGLESTLTFSIGPDSDLSTNSLSPGVVRWVSGMNAGRTYEIDSNTAGGSISLRFETSFPIQVGDELEYRPDCNKQARDGNKGCLHWFAEDWPLAFRGEPDIPIGDAGSMEFPGASAGLGQGATTFEPYGVGPND